MGLFDISNFITLGIVILILIVYRQIDRGSRNLKLLRDYSEKLKKELNSYVQEQEKAVKDYGVSLNVERDSARELMRQLQLTEEEMSRKAQSLSRIDTQLKTYESSLSDLDKMTAKVQENMMRIRDESSFVETASKKISDAKSRIDELEKDLDTISQRFNTENEEALNRTVSDIIAEVSTTVSGLSSTAEDIERQVNNHRLEISRIEESRAENMNRDLAAVNKILATVVEEAGKRADVIEEAALARLREQAEERIQKVKSLEEERLRTYHESAKNRVQEVQDLIKNLREEWRAERTAWEVKDKTWQEEYRMRISELSTLLVNSEKRMDDLMPRAENILSSQEKEIERAVEDMKQKALEISGDKLQEYRSVQELEFKRLESLTEDSRNLDFELRQNMKEMMSQIQGEFSLFKQELSEMQKTETNRFRVSFNSLKEELSTLGSDLEQIRSTARENVTEKVSIFEDEFISDMNKRTSEINRRFIEWQEDLESRLTAVGKEAQSARAELEQSIYEDMQKNLSSQSERMTSDLEHLKKGVSDLEEGIREQMSSIDESVVQFREQFSLGISEARKEAELIINTELSRHSVTSTENIRLYHKDIDEEKEKLEQKVKELDDTVENVRRRFNEFYSDTDSKITLVRSSVDDSEKHIRDLMGQTNKVEEIRRDIEKRIEDLRSDIDKLDQRRAEAAQLENEFLKIRRLEDDVNAKMTRFLSEKRRIESMEADFNRLLNISREVEEKLKHVTASDDTLQEIQLQIRKMEDALGSAEDKYQRMERKSQILENTSEGIDRNFRVLQESEKLTTRIGDNIERYSQDMDKIKNSIDTLARESEKANDAADKIEALDKALLEIEDRIKSMQRARQWIADAEKRLDDLNKETQIQVRVINEVLKDSSPRGKEKDQGSTLTLQQKKENIVTLTRMGWSKEQIAKNLKISISEVELTLEMASMD